MGTSHCESKIFCSTDIHVAPCDAVMDMLRQEPAQSFALSSLSTKRLIAL